MQQNKISLNSVEEFIQNKFANFSADNAVVLGSGLSSLVDDLSDKTILPYEDLPGFTKLTVKGHEGNFVLGKYAGVNTVFMQGRPHFYEGHSLQSFHIFIRAIKSFGCKRILMTNAAGSIDSNIIPGSIVLIKDHINMQFRNPLIGFKGEKTNFISMENAYNYDFRSELKQIAKNNNIKINEGVYVGVLGPMFETPAEVNAFRILGGQVVGMSTVPDVIVARYYGLEVAVLSTITNLAAGCGDHELSHDLTLSRAKLGVEKLTTLINGYLKQY